MPANGGERKRSRGRAQRTKEEEEGVPVRWGRVPCRGERGEGSGRPATTRRGGGGRRSGDARTGEEGVWCYGPHLEERGGTWVTPGTRGPAEKENGSGPKKQCNFLLNQK
jgi:hypothetical protein